jgi:hypothetical protein
MPNVSCIFYFATAVTVAILLGIVVRAKAYAGVK